MPQMITFLTASALTPTRAEICTRRRNKSVQLVLDALLHCFTYLRLCSVLVKACETGEVLLGNGRGKVGANHGVGVGWVAHHHHLCVGRRGREGEEREERREERDGERVEGGEEVTLVIHGSVKQTQTKNSSGLLTSLTSPIYLPLSSFSPSHSSWHVRQALSLDSQRCVHWL